MGKNAKMIHYSAAGGDGAVDEDGERMMEWEEGLPSMEDLLPLSQGLISFELMSAFSITPEPYRTTVEVNQASQDTISSLRGNSVLFSSNTFESYKDGKNRDLLIIEEDDEMNSDLDDFVSKKVRRIPEETDSVMMRENSTEDQSNQTLKRARLVWTPQLHKRFVEVVAVLGIENAVPKTILQMMNVGGLTREKVSSHLQKYRVYLKRMQGLSNEGPSSSDPVFGSTPVPQSLHEPSAGSDHGHSHMPIPPIIPPMLLPMPMPYPYPPHMMQMPVLGQGHVNSPYGNPNMGNYHGFDSHPSNNMMQQRYWSGSSSSSYPAPNEN